MAADASHVELEGDRSRRRAAFFWRLAVWSGGVGLSWLGLIALWLWPHVQEGWKLLAFVLPPFVMAVTSLLAAATAWAWAVRSLTQKRTPGGLHAERILWASAVVVALGMAGGFLWVAVNGLVTGEVIAGRHSRARVEDSPIVFWLLEAFWLLAAALFFYGLIRRRGAFHGEP